MITLTLYRTWLQHYSNRKSLFLKMGQLRPIFVYFRSFQKNIFLQQINVKNCHGHPVSGAGIQTHDFWNCKMSVNLCSNFVYMISSWVQIFLTEENYTTLWVYTLASVICAIHCTFCHVFKQCNFATNKCNTTYRAIQGNVSSKFTSRNM